MRTLAARAALTLLVLLAASELAHSIAARLYTAGEVSGSCTVFVLGYPTNGDGTASAVEIERMEAGIAALNAHQCAKMVISGGAAHNGYVEADVMAARAESAGVARDHLLLERQARDTKENIALSLPLIPAGENVLIVSNALHAQRGRRYFCAARPDDCSRTFVVPTAYTLTRLPQRMVESLHETVVFVLDMIG